VAEDQPVNWLLIERMLRKRGCEVDHAANGAQALDLLAAEDYDLVLLDCQMPILDGYETTREIRRRERATERPPIPIVAMTAHAMEGDRERCLEAGMDDYMAKPITSRDADRVLSRWLADRRSRERPPVDPARTAELEQLFPGAEAVAVLDQLVHEVAEQLERIATALARGDGSAIADSAHRVLNIARMVGAHGLAEATSRLEADADNTAKAQRDAAVVRERWRAVLEALQGGQPGSA
jgi:CheY-like chemotaxis protein